jgi:hypothetical protein
MTVLKKKRFWMILLIILIVVGGVVYYILYQQRVSKYKSNVPYDTAEGLGPFTISINAFLESVTEENDKKCLNLITIDEKFEDFQICEDTNIVNWENPYDDYSKLIPVNVLISFNPNLLSRYLVKNVEVSLLEDEDYVFLFDLDKGQDIFPRVHIKSTEDILRRGYYTTGTKGQLLVILENRIDKMEVDEDEITIYFTAVIEGQEVKLKLVEQEFYYFAWLGESRINITNENIEMLKPDTKFEFVFDVASSFNAEEYIDTLIESRRDTEYLLIDLKLYEISEIGGF